MGHAIDALPLGLKNVRNNPSLVLISYVAFLLTIPTMIVGTIVAFALAMTVVGAPLARVVMYVPVKILLFGGLVGAAGKGFTGDVGVDDYTSAIKDNLKGLGGAFTIYETVATTITFIGYVLMFTLLFGGAFALSSLQNAPSAMSTGVGLGVVVIYVAMPLVLLVLAVLFQFIDVAVVLGDEGATGAYKESLRLIKGAPLSVLGYTVLRTLLGVLVLLPGFLLTGALGQVSDALAYVGGVVTLLLFPAAFSLVMSYHAAYYGQRVRAR